MNKKRLTKKTAFCLLFIVSLLSLLVVPVLADTQPVASFSASPASGTAPLSVQFTDTSAGENITYSWDFGGSEGTSTDQHPSYTYSDAGNYTVILTASNEGGNTTATRTITVSSAVLPPTADFTANVTIGTPPLTVQFSDRSTGDPESWSWDFEESGGVSEKNPVHTFDSVGNYTISLTVENTGGEHTKTTENYIRVGYAPTADFTAVPRSGDNPLTVNFTDTSTHDPTSWEWDFGDGRSSSHQSPNHVYMYRERYNVTLTATNEFGSDEEIKTEYIRIDAPTVTSTQTPTPTVTTQPATQTATPTQTIALAATAVADETYAVAGTGDDPVRAEIQRLHSFYLEYIKLIKEILRI
ncbi:MAG: PKD domain-containing protein [Euryarchaeota archaeon]|nr:PKD domain-containing protein [Euryarchaeota archaeon]